MEFEKIKYLEEEEIKKRINEIKRKEKINMDEIATMLFSSVRGV
jgi:flagellar biosynthesis chaperone FliJ